MDKAEIIRWINYVISLLFFICYFYQTLYVFIPFIKKDKPHKETKLHRYAVLISARNEEAVIGHLIESIKGQDYPEELVSVFVVADNCRDRTAEEAVRAGAQVFEKRTHIC